MDGKIIEVKRRSVIFEDVKMKKTYESDKKYGQYIVKSRFTTAQSRLNVKSSDRMLETEGGLKKPVIGKALQQRAKYIQKGNQCFTKKEIGARF